MKKLYIILIILSVFNLPIHSQSAGRKKIGLVLSGGGARGFSQIGILKFLEKNNIKIDYITGTSIGAIIGALYASGYSAAEIENIILSADWNRLLSDNPDRLDLKMRERDAFEKSALAFDVENFALKLPEGLIFGQAKYNFLSDIFWHVKDVKNFNKLPIPFRCAALNIETGDTEILSSGDLVDSVRASMALPSIFSPIEIDGKILVDGGVKLNFPVIECRKMGADIVIAVDTRSSLHKKDELNTFTAIADQSIKVLMDANVKEQIDAADIILKPELEGYETLGFDKTGKLSTGGKRLL